MAELKTPSMRMLGAWEALSQCEETEAPSEYPAMSSLGKHQIEIT